MNTLQLTLGSSRLLIGITAWFAPDAGVRFFGIDTRKSDRFVTRLFGAREIALAASLLAAGPSTVGTVASVGAAIDAVDAIAGFDEARRGNLTTRATVLGPAGALVFTGLGIAIARTASR